MDTGTTTATPTSTEQQPTGPVSLSDLHDELTQTATEENEARNQKRRNDGEQEAAEREEAAEADHDPEAEAEENTLDLPESLQDYDSAAVAKMMERYGLDSEDLANPKFAQLLKDALDRGEDPELEEGEEADTEEAEPEQKTEPEKPAEQTPAQPMNPDQFRAHIEQIQQIVNDPTVNDPTMVQAFKNELLECFDAQTPEAKASVDRFANAAMIGATNMVSTLVPRIVNHLLPQMIESLLPGLADSHREAIVYNTWEDVRTSGQFGNDLPKFATPEFFEAAERVHAANPWLNTLEFRDAQGNLLPIRQALHAKAEVTAKLLSGEKLTAKMIAETYAQGKAHAEKNARRVSAGRAHGHGRSSGSLGAEERSYSLMDAYKERNSSGF